MRKGWSKELHNHIIERKYFDEDEWEPCTIKEAIRGLSSRFIDPIAIIDMLIEDADFETTSISAFYRKIRLNN